MEEDIIIIKIGKINNTMAEKIIKVMVKINKRI